MDLEPLAVVLKFAFIAVLYLTLAWIARSALRDLRRGVLPSLETTGAPAEGGGVPPPEAWLVAQGGGGLRSGDRIDLFGGLTIGRSPEAELTVEDDFASGIHARVYSRRGSYWLEDMGSTNGTFLNMSPVDGEARLSPGDRIRVGQTEFVYEA